MHFRKILNALLFALIAMCLVFSLVGCGDKAGGEGEEIKTPEVTPGTMSEINPALIGAAELSKSLDSDKEDVILFYYRKDGNYDKWGLWLWPIGGEAKDEDFTETKGKFEKDTTTGIAYINLSEANYLSEQVQDILNEGSKLNFIIRDENWGKDPDGDRTMDFSISKHFISLSGDSTVYPVTDSVAPSIKSASAFSSTELKVELSVKLGLEIEPSSNGFSLVADDSSVINVSDVKNFNYKNYRYNNYTDTLYVTLESPIDLSKNWAIKHEKFSPENGCPILTHEIFKNSDFVYKGNDLGLTLKGNIATFKTWAPVASNVSLLLYENATELDTPSTDPKPMTRTSDGIWTIENVEISSYEYYKFRIVNNGDTNDVCDIYAKACSPDSVASQIVDITTDSSSMPTSWETKYINPWTGTDYSDAVIYEMHIRDWSKAIGGDGKFIELAESEDFINHLKDIGITHVQILPAFDYAQPNTDENYNWGYNPYHYNVPEGRYVENMVDGTDAVKQFRELILALHNANIAVIMDVVYNHTAGTGKGSLYDMTVPYYYYRLNKDGTYSNGSGCGNETDSEAPMFKKYMIDTLKNWMENYHVNGFRFDLMGLHSKETMTDIYNELYKIDPKVMIYGEPWTGGTALVKNTTDKTISTEKGYGVGAFEDTFRNAIKGGEYGGFQGGHVQGTHKDNDIINGLLGKSGKNSTNGTSKPGLMLSYVECHDNYTLYDKLAISQFSYSGKNDAQLKSLWKKFADLDADKQKAVSDQNKLAAAYVFLAQGTPFINGGQEFMRDKDGDHNSYQSDDTVNGIDLGYKETHKDVYNVYKGLIAFRKQNSEAFGNNKNAIAIKLKAGVTQYAVGNFLVYFNATKDDFAITPDGYTKVIDVTSGTPTESTTLPPSVPAKGFVILKK